MRLMLIIVLCLLSTIGNSQTCCSGGVPVSSNLGFSLESPKTLQLSIVSDFNTLQDLYAGRDKLDDDQRKRTTQSYLIRAGYSLSKKLNIETSMSFVRQTRKIYSNSGEDFQSTFGIGDPVFIVIYDLLQFPVNIRLGLGTQVPLGSTSKKSTRGLFLVEDLQPGSGAFDLVSYSSLIYTFKNNPNMTIFSNVIFSLSGTNHDSRGGAQSYEFGNDLQLISGWSNQVIIAEQIFNGSIGFRYRKVSRDKVDNIENSGTGGQFFFLRTNLTLLLSQNWNITINGEIPLYTYVNETQLATSFSFNIGITKKLAFHDKSDPLNNF